MHYHFGLLYLFFMSMFQLSSLCVVLTPLSCFLCHAFRYIFQPDTIFWGPRNQGPRKRMVWIQYHKWLKTNKNPWSSTTCHELHWFPEIKFSLSLHQSITLIFFFGQHLLTWCETLCKMFFILFDFLVFNYISSFVSKLKEKKKGSCFLLYF